MKIRFKKTDPRAGMEIEMDEYRAKQLIEAGSAEAVGGTKAEVAPENKAEAAAPENKAAPAKPAKKATKKAK